MCVITRRSIYQLTSVSLTDWDWYTFGIHRIYGCFDTAFLLNHSRASNDEMAWESGPMVWGSPGVTVTDSTLCTPFHTPNQPRILFFSSERRKKKEKTIQDYIYILLIICSIWKEVWISQHSFIKPRYQFPFVWNFHWPTEIYVSVIIIIIFKGFPPAALFLFRFDLVPLDGLKIGHLHLFHTQSSDKEKKNNPVVHFCMFSVCEHKWHWGRWGGFSSTMKKGAVKLCSLM